MIRLATNADRRDLLRRSASPRVVPGATLAVPQRRVGEGLPVALGLLPNFSRRVRLSPYAAYLAALAVICGP